MKKIGWFFIVFIGVLISVSAFAIENNLSKNGIVIQVGNDIIEESYIESYFNNKEEYKNIMSDNNKRQVFINFIINNELFYLKWKLEGYDNLEFAKKLESIKKQIAVETIIKTLHKTVDEEIVSIEELKQFYEANKEQFANPSVRLLKHILLSNEKTAIEVMNILIDGADFSETAKKYSIDDTKDIGGEVGKVPDLRGGHPIIVETFNAKPGVPYGPVESDAGYHILLVGESEFMGIEPFEECVETRVRPIYKHTKFEKLYIEEIEKLKKSFDVKVFE